MQQRSAGARVRSLPLREVPWAQEMGSVGSVTGAEEEGGHRARGSKRLWMMGTEAWPLAIR